jgi:hypothetical protein
VIKPREGEIDGSVARMGKERHAHMSSMGRNGGKGPSGKHTELELENVDWIFSFMIEFSGRLL